MNQGAGDRGNKGDTDNTKKGDGTTLQENVDNRDDGTISSDASYSKGVSPQVYMPLLYEVSWDNTDDSDDDTGYGENNESNNQGRHGSQEDVSGNHNSEAKCTNKTTSRTTSPNAMEQPGLQPRLSQEGCDDDR